MTEPTDKHREEAREMFTTWRKDSRLDGWINDKCGAWDDLVNRIASALASRDAEVSEVLAGLITHRIRDKATGEVTRHWCLIEKDGYFECNPACLAARGLWERAKGEQK